MTKIRPAHERRDLPPGELTQAEHYEHAVGLFNAYKRRGVTGGGAEGLLAAQLHLALSTHPNTPEEAPDTPPTDGMPRAETSEYASGWHDCMTMRLLHDRIPGFAIVRPRETDPFEFNRETLAEYGITDPGQMYAVARAPHGTPVANPVKRPAPTEPQSVIRRESWLYMMGEDDGAVYDTAQGWTIQWDGDCSVYAVTDHQGTTRGLRLDQLPEILTADHYPIMLKEKL